MLSWFKRKHKHIDVRPQAVVETTLDQMREAVLRFESEMPEGINRIALLKSDGRLDASRLTRYLGGVSDRDYYVSRETFEIFEEKDREIPYYLDLVQAAVDNYMDETGKLPVIDESSQYQVDFSVLLRGHYLKEKPPFPLYVTDQEMMLTHRPK
jgi:hypothetical protein